MIVIGRPTIGLYRDVWIAAIASSRTCLATQTAAICVRFQGRCIRHAYVTMQFTFLTRKPALIYRRGLRQRVASLTLDCNGVFAIKSYYHYCYYFSSIVQFKWAYQVEIRSQHSCAACATTILNIILANHQQTHNPLSVNGATI